MNDWSEVTLNYSDPTIVQYLEGTFLRSNKSQVKILGEQNVFSFPLADMWSPLQDTKWLSCFNLVFSSVKPHPA